MKRTKAILAILLAGMTALALTGCGGSSLLGSGKQAVEEGKEQIEKAAEELGETLKDIVEDATDKDGSGETEETGAAETPAEDPAEEKQEEASGAGEEASGEAAPEETGAEAAAAEDGSIVLEGEPPWVFTDNETFKLEALALDKEGFGGYTWNVTVENKTDKEILVSATDGAVNGVCLEPWFAQSLAAGESKESTFAWSNEEAEARGVGDFTVMQFTLNAYDGESYDLLFSQKYVVYPQGQGAASYAVREAQPGDQVVFEDENCAIILTGIDPEGDWGYTVNAYLLNKADTPTMFSIGTGYVNGIEIDPFWASEVGPGLASYEEISWSDSKFEENGITSVESIELEWNAYDNNDWSKDHYFEETVSVELG